MITHNIPPPDLANETARYLLDTMEQESQRRIAVHKRAFDAFWNSPDATPQQIAAAMGTAGASFFKLAGENIEHLSRSATLVGGTLTDYMAPAEWQPPKTVTINTDGTVTIGV
jgi:hypothetical protein